MRPCRGMGARARAVLESGGGEEQGMPGECPPKAGKAGDGSWSDSGAAASSGWPSFRPFYGRPAGAAIFSILAATAGDAFAQSPGGASVLSNVIPTNTVDVIQF